MEFLKRKWESISEPIKIAIALSIVVLALAIVLGLDAKTGKSIYPPSNLSANQWGEFISGVAGALAFVWIIATVFIQSKELELQREELQQSRKVAKEQAEFIGKQTELLQRETDERNYALTLEAIHSVEDQISRLVISPSFIGFNVSMRDGNGDLVNVDLLGKSAGVVSTFSDIVRRGYEWSGDYRSRGFAVGLANAPDQFDELLGLCRRWDELSVGLPEKHALKRKYAGEMILLRGIMDFVRPG